MTKELPRHSVIRTLTIHDIDALVRNEEAGFPPHERCSKEKMEYRLRVCPELSSGVFIRQFHETGDSESVKQSLQNHDSNTTEADESDDHGNATDADTDAPAVKPVTLPPGKSSLVSEKLIAHILATKTTSMFITDESMELPDIDEYGRPKDPNDQRGHREDGRTIGIHSLVVDPDYQGRSVGSILLKDYIQRITTQHIADRISLIAHPELVPFYRRFDFADYGVSQVKFGGGGWHDMSAPLKEEDDDMP